MHMLSMVVVAGLAGWSIIEVILRKGRSPISLSVPVGGVTEVTRQIVKAGFSRLSI